MLRHAAFRNVWLGAMGSSVGTWMEGVGVQWVMAEQTGSTLMMGYLAAAQLGPTLVLGVFAGLVADRVNRKRLLLVSQAVMMLVAAMLAAASWQGWATPRALIGLMLLHGITLAFNTPAWQVLTPRLVPREELGRAIALNALQFNLARVIGPGVAGLLMAVYGPTVLFVVNTLSFVGVLIAVARTPDSPAPAQDSGRTAWAQVREAFEFVFARKGPRRIFVGLVVFSMLAAPIQRMLPLFVSEVYHAREEAYGALLSIMGAGAVAGGLALRLVPAWYPRHHLIPLSITGAGLTITLFSGVERLGAAGVILFLMGFFWLWTFSSSMTALQLLVGDAMRGRVLAISNTAVFGVMPLGSLLAGLIGESTAGTISAGHPGGASVRIGVGSLAAALAVAGLAMLIWRTPEIDGLRPGERGHRRRAGLIVGVTASAHRPQRERRVEELEV